MIILGLRLRNSLILHLTVWAEQQCSACNLYKYEYSSDGKILGD